MIKITLLISAICVFGYLPLSAQKAFTFMGGTFSNSSVSVTFSGGETLTGNFQNSSMNVSGGFIGVNDILGVSNEQNVADLPQTFGLSQNYPNPFNPSTNINYELPEPATIRLEVFNSIGSSVALLENNQKPAGRYTVQFNAARLASGMYFYRLIANGRVIATQKMLLIK